MRSVLLREALESFPLLTIFTIVIINFRGFYCSDIGLPLNFYKYEIWVSKERKEKKCSYSYI